jgi:hypothetical protein
LFSRLVVGVSLRSILRCVSSRGSPVIWHGLPRAWKALRRYLCPVPISLGRLAVIDVGGRARGRRGRAQRA